MQKTNFKPILFLTFCAFQLLTVSLYSQAPYNFVKYSNKEGFNQNTIFAIEQDKSGFLWIGTVNGLIKYDGYDFFNFTYNLSYPSGVPQDRIKNLHTCNKGLLWIVSQNALHAYFPEYEKFYDIFSGSIVHFNRVVELQDGSIWALGENYISRIYSDIRKDTILFQVSSNLLSAEYGNLNINDMVEMNELLLLATHNGLLKASLKDSILEIQQLSDELSDIRLTRILSCHDNKNMFWIGSSSGMIKAFYDNNKLHILNRYLHEANNINSISDNEILDIIPGKDKDLWIGTFRGGISSFNTETEIFSNYTYNPRNTEGISSAHVNCVYLDNFNVLWIGTAQGGLSKLDLNQKRFINLHNNPFDHSTISGDLINCVLEDSKGHLWVSSYYKPLSRSISPVEKGDASSILFKHYNHWFDTYPDKDILSVYEDKYGYFWLGYTGSLVIYNPSRDLFTQITIQKEGGNISLRGLRNILPFGDDKLIIAGSSVTIIENPWKYLANNKTIIPAICNYTFPETPDERNMVMATLVDSKNRLWIGTRSNGVSCLEFNEGGLTLLRKFGYSGTDEKGLNHNAVFSLYEDRNENIWMGTFGGGLNKLVLQDNLSNPSFEYVGTHQGLPDNAIYGIIPENDSVLWLSTDMGLCRYNSISGDVSAYNINDGIASNNYRRNAHLKGYSGYFYFGGLNGLTLFRPQDIRANGIPPLVKLVNIEINNQRIKAGEYFNNRVIIETPVSELSKLVLTHKENSVAFEFLVQHYSSPVNNKMEYCLEGFDKGWISLEKGKFKQVYTNLPAGNYQFRVRGYNRDRLGSLNEIALPVDILAPWYKRWWSYFMFGILIFSIGLGVSWYFIKFERLEQRLQYEQKDKERIQQINQAKLQFFTSISHEFKTPLSLISATFQLFQRDNLNDGQKKQLSLLDKNTKRLINLIDQLLTFRKSEQGHLKLKPARYSLGSFFYPIAEAFENYSLKTGINFIHNVKNAESPIIIDYEKMERVLFNILSNAFKFTPVNGTVKFEGCIESDKDRNYVRFDVYDNGKGIPKEELSNIFERFYQLDTQSDNEGTGIGLSLSKSIVELHKGYIEVESNPDILTRFSVFIPKEQEIDPHNLRVDLQKNRMEEYLNLDTEDPGMSERNNNLPLSMNTILMVEDEKEFRDIIREVLTDNYKIIEAKNGMEALEILSSDEPDLIISDVMMPKMNGYDLCKKVKSDIQTCHIPVILLTALGEEDMQIQGVEYGADAYITKPFNVKFLLVTIRKLIENRSRIKDHFSRSFTLPPDSLLSTIDQTFIESVNKIIEQNLDDSGFGVEMLAKEVCLSTSQFYRKLKLLTGQVPNAYIRNFRLQKAADLISANPDLSMKTVMFEIGIESASYFTHAFKKKFGVLPSEFNTQGVKYNNS